MVKIRKYHWHGKETGKWEADVRVELATGEMYRSRKPCPEGSSKAEARAFGEDHEQEVRALAVRGLGLDQVKRALRGELEEVLAGGDLTVEKAVESWLEQRKAEGVPSYDDESQRLREHVLPLLGTMKVKDVRPKHAYHLVNRLKRTPSRRGGVLANRTVRSVYFLARAVFQHLVFEEVIAGNPFVVAKGVLPKVQDKDPTWRPKAVFTTAEVEQLISDDRVAPHRRVAYAIEFLTGLRTGQVSALTWGDYEQEIEPLGRMMSAVSWDSKAKVVKGTKTGVVHEVPVHPALAKVLGGWKLTGWRKRMGRTPKADDLIVPTIRGTHRDVRKALEDFHEDLERLGLRKRRHYDSRRTFISLGLDGGASKDILQSITHPRPKDAFDLYRTASWEARCEAVVKVRVAVREGTVVPLQRVGDAHFRGGVVEAERQESQG